MFAEWATKGKPSVLGGISGAVAGLVAITPASGFVLPVPALIIGVVAGLAGFWGATALKHALRLRRQPGRLRRAWRLRHRRLPADRRLRLWGAVRHRGGAGRLRRHLRPVHHPGLSHRRGLRLHRDRHLHPAEGDRCDRRPPGGRRRGARGPRRHPARRAHRLSEAGRGGDAPPLPLSTIIANTPRFDRASQLRGPYHHARHARPACPACRPLRAALFRGGRLPPAGVAGQRPDSDRAARPHRHADPGGFQRLPVPRHQPDPQQLGVQGTLDIQHDSGFYIGSFVCNAKFLASPWNDTRQEVDCPGRLPLRTSPALTWTSAISAISIRARTRRRARS